MKAFKTILNFRLIGQGFAILYQNQHLPGIDIFMFNRTCSESSAFSCDVLICENVDLCFEKVGVYCLEINLGMN